MKLFHKLTHKPTREDYRNDIRRVVRLCSDQKLMQVLEACEAGKLSYINACHCLVGVLSSDDIHKDCGKYGMDHHYQQAIDNPIFDEADNAYRILGYRDGDSVPPRAEYAANRLTQSRRDKELATLLREEMATRTTEEERTANDTTPVEFFVRDSETSR